MLEILDSTNIPASELEIFIFIAIYLICGLPLIGIIFNRFYMQMTKKPSLMPKFFSTERAKYIYGYGYICVILAFAIIVFFGTIMSYLLRITDWDLFIYPAAIISMPVSFIISFFLTRFINNFLFPNTVPDPLPDYINPPPTPPVV